MRRDIFTEIEIRASRDQLWEVITDFHAYPHWNPFVRMVTGTAVKGSRLVMVLKPQELPEVTIRPTIVVSTPSRELRWQGRFFLPAFLDHEHFFRLRYCGPRVVRFSHGGSFSGALVAFTSQATERRFRASFVSMNIALKTHAERRDTHRGYKTAITDPQGQLSSPDFGLRPSFVR